MNAPTNIDMDAHVALDPFGFFPGHASRVAGLGGDGIMPDPHYAFHTAYVPAQGRQARFVAHFSGVTASRGTLTLQINALPAGSASQARPVGRKRIALRNLTQDTLYTLQSEAFAGTAYALVGTLSTDADIRAERLEVWLADMGQTQFDNLGDTPGPIADLLSRDAPTLADPVSQMCTAEQFDEPAYAEWSARMGEPIKRHRKQWEFIYILQTLRRYGTLQPGARGLGFGVGREPIPAILASMGVRAVATDLPFEHGDVALWHASGQHISAIDSLSRPLICDDARLADHVIFQAIDMTAIPADLKNFDFTWSSCAFEHLGSIEEGLHFVERSVGCLRPGGLAVHTTELNLSSNEGTLDHASTVLFRRRDMELLALRLIAAGHKVAPIKFDSGRTPLDRYVDLPPYESDVHLKIAFGQYTTTSFGIAIQRGLDT